MHPSEGIRGSRSQKLAGKRVVLGVTGSIAAVECVKLARELIRHGAQVYPVMSRAAQGIIHPDALEFATGQAPITKLSGKVEHVSFCGDVPERADLLLIAPATANTIGKMACGIDDTPVTTFATTAIGTGIPVLVSPAMHETMHRHRIVQENIEKLKAHGVTFISPRVEEKKAKIAGIDTIVAEVIRALGPGNLKGKKALVIAGATSEAIDDVRAITNTSSGGTGVALAREAFFRGAYVSIWMGQASAQIPEYVSTARFTSTKELLAMVDASPLDFDFILVPAAIADFSPEKHEGKLSSETSAPTIRLSPNPKVIKEVRTKFDGVLVGFKAESGIGKDELAKRAFLRLSEAKLDFIVANDIRDVTNDSTRVCIIDSKKNVFESSGSKLEVAENIWKTIL